MVEFFKSVLGYLQQFWDIVSNLFASLGLAVTFVSDAVPIIGALFGYLPTVVSACCICTLVLMIIKFIIAR